MEGRKEGETKKTIELIENFLRHGVGWDVIRQATGIDPEGFEHLRKKMPE
jgi:hypothetical protein